MRIDLIHDSGGYREEETPCPISNQEAKLFIADNTLSYWDGNVGRCQFRDFTFLPFINSPYNLYILLLLISIVNSTNKCKNYLKLWC